MLKRISITGMAGLALVASGCGGSGSSSTLNAVPIAKPATVEIGRNVVRVPGVSAGDISSAAVLADYDPTRARTAQPDGWVLVPDNDWHAAVLGSQFAARPVSAPLLSIDPDFIPTAPGDVMARVQTKGFPKAQGLRVLVLDKVGNDVFIDLDSLGLKPTTLDGAPAKLAATLVPFRGGWAGTYSDTVVIVSGDARDYALPAAAWSAYSGDTIAFVGRNDVPRATRDLLVQREKLRLRKPSIYVIGPSTVVSDGVLRQLARYGPVRRIAGRDAIDTSVALARFHDPKTGFGWGMSKGPASVSLVNVHDWSNAIGALDFAASGPQAPILLTDSATALPDSVRHYLEGLRGPKPSQAFVFGTPTSIGQQPVADLDGLLDARP